jgi:hypothetical protein
MTTDKSQSPFYPGHPVPTELFVGRASQVDRIVRRGVHRTAEGRPYSIYVQGEYGIGKSSVARLTQWLAERDHGLLGIYAMIGGATTLDDIGAAILQAAVRSGAYDPKITERVTGWLGKYVGEQSLFGLTIHTEALRREGPKVAEGILPFLRETLQRVEGTGVKGIFLILDEINGIAANPGFAHFIKNLVDANALDREPIPLLLMLCGVEERRREMIRHHQPIDRIFDVVEIEPLSETEMGEFFERAFSSVNIRVEPAAMSTLTHYSAGLPRIMHLVGDAAFWLDTDGVITNEEAMRAVLDAADEVGKRYVDQQVYRALRSSDYHSILSKVGKTALGMSFRKADVAAELTETEKRKFNNFLQKMKRLNVIRSGDVQGEYQFNVRMVAVYIWLNSRAKGSA